MYAGIGGMKNFQTKLDVIGNNISNVNTFGFKKGRTTFKDLVSQQLSGSSSPTDLRGGMNPRQVGLGGTLASIDTIHSQGSLQTTGRALDLGISGDGFFIVNDGDLSSYTRAGNFYLDRQGTLVTSDGLRVQGFRPDPGTGEIDPNNFGDLTVAVGDVFAPQATNEASFKGNLNANMPIVGSQYGGQNLSLLQGADAQSLTQGDINNALKSGSLITYKVNDSLGDTHEIKLIFQNQGADANGNAQWSVGYLAPTLDLNPDGSGTTVQREDNGEKLYTYHDLSSLPGVVPPEDRLRFDSNGQLLPPDPVTSDPQSMATIDFAGINPRDLTPGLATTPGDLNIELNFEDLNQFVGSNSVDAQHVNGNAEGYLESYNVWQTGEVTGVYTNGEVRILGQIALATFNNPEGLNKSGDNLYQVSNNSGQPNLGFAGDARGVMMSSTLEMSNVDLSEEFTEMIVAQRGFQANTKIITTSDEILQELVNLKR